jgi:hypothetical protein
MHRLPWSRRGLHFCNDVSFSKGLYLFKGYAGLGYAPTIVNNICARNVFISTALPPVTSTVHSYTEIIDQAAFDALARKFLKIFLEVQLQTFSSPLWNCQTRISVLIMPI